MANLGFVGIGAMGMPMAMNLLRAGHAVTVYARRADRVAALVEAGGRAAASPAAVASQSEVVFTMVTDGAAVEEVVLGPRGIIHESRPEMVVVDHSTIAPDSARRIAAALIARQVEMLDAPVSGGVGAAAEARLSIMVGGNQDVFERCRPLLAVSAKVITYIGPAGAGQVAKACNQIGTIVNQQGAAEAMLLAERAGVDPGRVRDAMMAGFAASRMLELQAPKMIARDFDGKVESRLHYKDIGIVLDLARAIGIVLPASAAAETVLKTLQDRGGARNDSAAIFTTLDQP